MKKLAYFVLALMLISQSMFSQTTYKEKETIEIPERFSSYTDIEYSYKYVGGQKVYNGPIKINENYDLSYGSDFAEGNDIYKLSANYKDGMLNGTFTMSSKQNYSYPDWDHSECPIVVVNETSSFSGKFVDGVPDGPFKVYYTFFHNREYNTTYKNSSCFTEPDPFKISILCTFKKGILVGSFSMKSKEGKYGSEEVVSGAFTSDGKMTGKWSVDGETGNCLNGVILDDDDYDATLKTLAKKFGEAKLTLEQLQKDYCVVVEEEENDLLETVADLIIAKSAIIPWYKIKGYDFESVEMPPVQKLTYLPSVTEEGIEVLISSIRSLEKVTSVPDAYFGSDNYACKYVTCNKSEGVSAHCKNIDWYNYGPYENVKIYLTDAQYQRLWNEFAVKYEDYLSDKYQKDFDKAIDNDETVSFIQSLGCTSENIAKYTPLVSYELTGTKKENDMFVMTNEIDVADESGVGFKSYKWDICLDAKTYVLNPEKTFDPANLVQVPNQYDTINVLLDSIKVNTEAINVASKDALKQSRNSYAEKLSVATVVMHDNLAETINVLRNFLKAQEGAVQWMNRSAVIQAKNNEIYALATDYTDVKNAFNRICESVDCSWNEANDTTQLEKMAQLQERAVEFIRLRGVIRANNQEIFSKVPEFSNLKSAYKSYVDAADVSMSMEIDFTNLQNVIEVQTKTIPFISLVNALAETDKAITKGAAAHADVNKAYAEYIQANSALWTPEVDNAAYEKMKDVQALTLQFVALRDEIAKNEEAIQKSGASAPSILAPYTEFVAKVDLTWTPDVDLEKLQKHIQMQQQSQKMIDNNAKIVENSAKIREEGAVHVDLITAYNMYIGSDIVWTPEVDVASTEKILDVQQKTLTFVQLRNTVVENDVYLKEKSSAGKGLYKLYTTYRKTAVLTWTSEVDMTAIETLIGIQEDCKTMLAYDDIKGICKAIKKAKIKDVVTAIQNYKK